MVNLNGMKKKILYYKVENFRIITKQATAYVPVCRDTYIGNINIYEMDLIKGNDTIHEIYVTTINERFIDGDSVYLWFNRWLLKN